MRHEDAPLFETAANEISEGRADRALAAKAYSLAEGDEKKAKALYLQFRVERLKEEQKAERERAADNRARERLAETEKAEAIRDAKIAERHRSAKAWWRESVSTCVAHDLLLALLLLICWPIGILVGAYILIRLIQIRYF